ncbi:nickel/cobalt transporter [Arsenophonus nasoniae]|uniref:nickel/cobalt transporter n=1 Tax=Arsenophonus nasoniae TaxID=638 RepID=UPI00387A7B14
MSIMPNKRAINLLNKKYSIVIGLFSFVFVGLSFYLYKYWHLGLQLAITWQRELNQHLSSLLIRVANSPTEAGLLLVAFSFLYGLLHALGPGHGKIIITTYIATHSSRLKKSLTLTLLASILQGSIAILLTSIVLGLLQLSSRHLHLSRFWLEKLSYGFVFFLGLLLCLKAISRLRKIFKKSRHAPYQFTKIHSPTQQQHSPGCNCGHKHVLSDEELQSNWRTQLAVIAAMGARPCSGALIVLLFSYVIGVYFWGIIAALMMALGTAITISGIALLVHSARHLAIRYSKWQGFNISAYWTLGIMLIGGIVLTIVGLLMYQSVEIPKTMGSYIFGR